MKVDGKCLCGFLTYEAQVDPQSVLICNCTDCQTLSGSAFRVTVQATDFRLLSGTPTTVGSSTVTIRGTDANGCFAERTFVMAITPATCPVITLSPATLPTGFVGLPYSQTLTASGGTAPYVFIVSAGTLPAGMTLTPAGVLSGTPTTQGTSSITIRATDANGCLAERPYTILIVPPVPTLPQIFVVLLALGLMTIGYVRLKQRARAK